MTRSYDDEVLKRIFLHILLFFPAVLPNLLEKHTLKKQRDLVKVFSIALQAFGGENYHASVLVDRHPVRTLPIIP